MLDIYFDDGTADLDNVIIDIPDDCKDVLYVKGTKVTIEEYEDAYGAYCEVIRERMKEYE